MLELFNVTAYLRSRRIPYTVGGSHGTEGWIQVRCPFCGDDADHLGINLQSRMMNCWRCGPKGAFTRYIVEVEGVTFREAQIIIAEFHDYNSISLPTELRLKKTDWNKVILPKELLPKLPSSYRDYLADRGFDPDYLIEKYQLLAGPNWGEWSFRIIAPVFFQGKIVNFTARTIAKGVQPPYKNCPNEEAIIPMKECLYNLDSVRDTALVVEGPADVWRIGDGAVATMGIQYTAEQVALLADHGVKKVVVMFDGEPLAVQQARKMARALSTLIPIVEVYELGGGDPGELPEREVLKIREEVFR